MPARCATCDFFVRPEGTNQAKGLCRYLGPGTRPELPCGSLVSLAPGLVYVSPRFGCVAHQHNPGSQWTADQYRVAGYRSDLT